MLLLTISRPRKHLRLQTCSSTLSGACCRLPGCLAMHILLVMESSLRHVLQLLLVLLTSDGCPAQRSTRNVQHMAQHMHAAMACTRLQQIRWYWHGGNRHKCTQAMSSMQLSLLPWPAVLFVNYMVLYTLNSVTCVTALPRQLTPWLCCR